MAFLGVASRVSTTKGLKGTIAFFVFFMYIVHLKSHAVEARKEIEQIQDDLELEEQLKILNVPHPLKTITVDKGGDILDCVDIHKQPTLSHPLLKDHKIQMKPSVFPKWGANRTSSTAGPFLITSELEGCPDGTVPIRRVLKEDLLGARLLSEKFTTMINQSKRHFPGQLIADVNYQWDGHLLHGASAFLNVYNPSLSDNKQFTSIQIWINGGPNDNPNYIMAGWTVNPSLYRGDKQTRLFTFWTGDNYKNGCYNNLCKGYVQVHPKITPSYVVNPVSTIGGAQYEIQVVVHQDRASGNWWLKIQNQEIGYWPKDLFNSLREGAKGISWGGLVNVGSNGDVPPMGSGPWPRQRSACYLRLIEYLDEDYKIAHTRSEQDVKIRVDNKDCNDVNYIPYDEAKKSAAILIGGPGGHC